MISSVFVSVVNVNQLGVFGLSCLINTCYDKKIHNRLSIKRIQRHQDPPYSLMEEGLTDRSGVSVRQIIIADVIDIFRLEGVCDSIKSPLAPLFEKGGTLTLRHCSLRP